jgi:hypothetical protein
MSNLLSTAKKVLKETAIEFYNNYADDLPLEKSEFKRHYSNLGEMLFEIDSIESFTDLISKLENNFFDQLGYHNSDEDMLEEFLREVREAQ